MGDLKPIFSYLKPYRRELAAAIILLLAECIFEMVIPLLMTDIVDVGVPNHDIGFLYRQGGLMALCAVLALVSGFLYARFAARAAYGWGARIREVQYQKVQGFAFSNLDHFESHPW